MKVKIFALSIAMVAGIFSANAQECKKTNDIFVGLGGGVISVMTEGFNTPAVYGQLQVGRYVTPVWGLRGVVAGPFQNIDTHNGSSVVVGDNNYSANHKLFGEFNLDGMVNLSSAIKKGEISKLDLYLFAGPQMTLSTVGTAFTGSAFDGGVLEVANNDDLRTRFGATAGAGLGFNITKAFELAVEGRVGVAPSIFGDASIARKAETTGRLTLNAVYTIGGKHGKAERVDAAAKCAGYLTAAEAAALAAAAVENNPKIVEKIVEKEVIKEVVKEVGAVVPASTAVFFQINKYNLTPADKARIQLYAEDIKNCDCNFTVAGYADKATGSVKGNQKLSEQRAETVYNALIAEGVPASRLEKVANGGVEAMFFNNDALSRAVIVSPVK